MIAPDLQERLRAVRHLVVFTGAGMSAESGIPTFRDRAKGLWAKVDPAEVATPHAFRKNPQFVWDWHVHLADAVRQAPAERRPCGRCAASGVGATRQRYHPEYRQPSPVGREPKRHRASWQFDALEGIRGC
jgi:hypothetical protein